MRKTNVSMLVILSVFLSGCSTPAPDVRSLEPLVQSQERVDEAISETEELIPIAVDLPFTVLSRPGAGDDVRIQDTSDAEVGSEGVDWTVLGVTHAEGAMPGPLPRVMLDSTEAFGSKMTRVGTGELTSLEQIPSELGVISTHGEFTPLPDLRESMVPLEGSNPDSLYFEPQHASVNGDWVVWREASAGRPGAMPTLDADDWRVLAWNRNENHVMELASAYLLHGDRFAPYASWDMAPSTDGEYVYFEASQPKGKDQWENTIFRMPLTDPGVMEPIGPGVSPAAKPEGGGAYWVKSNDDEPTEIVEDSVPLLAVTGGWFIPRIAVSDELLVATVVSEGSAWLLVWNRENDALDAAIDTGSSWAEVSVSGESFVWGNSSAASDATMYHRDPSGAITAIWATEGMSAPLTYGGTIAAPLENELGAIVWAFLEWEGPTG